VEQRSDVIVLGAGHNGLTAACYLARAGLDVQVVEAQDIVGGMTVTTSPIEEAPEHRINEGSLDASLFRASSISADLELPRYGLREMEIDPSYVVLDAEGGSLCLWRDPRRTAAELEKFSRKDARTFLELARVFDAAMDFLVPMMLTNPTRPAARNVAQALKVLAKFKRIPALTRLLTVSQTEFIDDYFESPLVRGALVALNPLSYTQWDGTGWHNIYFGFIHRFGISRFIGGTGNLSASLHRCLEAAGGRVRTGAAVEKLLVHDGEVTGVRLAGGEELTARAVVTSCNPKTTLTRLLPEGVLSEPLAKRASHIPIDVTKGITIKVNAAFSGRLELPRHQARRDDGVDLRKPLAIWHTLEQYEQAWDACLAGELPDPIPYLCAVPSSFDPSQAPDGQDTFWGWSGVTPAHPKEPWEKLADRAADQMLKDAAQYYTGIDELQIGRQVLTGPRIEKRFWAQDGNIFHVDPVLLRHGPFRPAQGFGGYRTPVPGLYLSGAGTHPTAGICGIPGQLAAREVLKKVKAG